MIKINSGIYSIKNIINDKIYIGSTKNFEQRWSQHKSELRGGYHQNIHLQRAWNKYGESCFEFVKEKVCHEKDLLVEEQIYINKYFGKDVCYNINPFSTKPPIANCKKVFLYDLKGYFVEKFDSMSECAQYVNSNCIGREESSRIKKSLKSKSGYYKGFLVKNEFLESIEPYKKITDKEIYLIDDSENKYLFKNSNEVLEYINGDNYYDKRKELVKLCNCLCMKYKYNNKIFIYKEDYEKGMLVYFKRKCVLKPHKYILKYSETGDLIDVLDNSYGTKISSKIKDVAKKNTRKLDLDSNTKLCFNKEFEGVFVFSNEVINNINTNIEIIYLYKDNILVYKSSILKEVIEFIGCSKSEYEYYFKKIGIVNNYKIVKKKF